MPVLTHLTLHNAYHCGQIVLTASCRALESGDRHLEVARVRSVRGAGGRRPTLSSGLDASKARDRRSAQW